MCVTCMGDDARWEGLMDSRTTKKSIEEDSGRAAEIGGAVWKDGVAGLCRVDLEVQAGSPAVVSGRQGNWHSGKVLTEGHRLGHILIRNPLR